MNIKSNELSETERLENLWAGDFGDQYAERNKSAANNRAPFWKSVLEEFPVNRVLEVGCNIGLNLECIVPYVQKQAVYGIDIGLIALKELRTKLPEVNSVWSQARNLPFRDRWFDMTFTMGVLIHQPETTLPLVMSEVVRCSRKYVLCGEYFSDETVEVPYREQTGALFKRNYGQIYQELFPELTLIKKQFLGADQGFDDVTVWIFEKQS